MQIENRDNLYPGREINFSYNFDERQKVELNRGDFSPYGIIEKMDTFTGSQSAIEIIDNAEAEYEDPDKKIIIGYVGEPASGKSTLLAQSLNRLLRPDSNIRKVAERYGRQIRTNIIPWGDAVLVEPSGTGEIPNEKLSREQLETQAKNSSEIFRFALNCVLSDKNKKFIDIIGFDIPSVTGAEIDGEKIGIVRALDVLYALVNKEDGYVDLGERYDDPVIIGVAASNQVRLWNKKNRSLIESAVDIQSKENILKERGIFLNLIGRNVLEFVREDASCSDVNFIESEVNVFLEGLIQKGIIRGKTEDHMDITNFSFLNPPKTLTKEYLKSFKSWHGNDIRASLIGNELFPWIFNDYLHIPPHKRAILYNNKIFRRVNIFDIEGQRYPIRDIYSTIFRNIKKGILDEQLCFRR